METFIIICDINAQINFEAIILKPLVSRTRMSVHGSHKQHIPKFLNHYSLECLVAGSESKLIAHLRAHIRTEDD